MRNRHKVNRRIALIALALTAAMAPASVGATERDPGTLEPVPLEAHSELEDGHEHHDEEELYLLDAASSAPGATFFNESSGCGENSGAMTPATTTNSSANRSIPAGHQVRGPWGDFFGRDYSDVANSMVEWTVPMSGGRKVFVHQRAYPAFQLVSQNLAARAAEGKNYNVRIAATWVWRRIGNSYRMSTHAFGTTIDINWDTNPYRSDNELVTDMPSWFVQAWKDAGFCWGGDWQFIKDTMHFSWMGPKATPGYGSLPAPYAPNTAKANFTDEVWDSHSGFSSADGGSLVVSDGNGDGAPDLVRIRDHGADGVQISFARSSKNFRRCGVSSWTAHGAKGADEYIVADFDGDSRPDLWALDTGGSRVTVEAFTYESGYRDSVNVTTGATPRSGASYLSGDYNRDGRADLIVVTPGSSTRVEVWSGSNSFGTRLVDGSASLDTSGDWQFSIGDHDVDGRDDVVAIDSAGSVRLRTLLAKDGYSGSPVAASTGATASSGDHFAMGDLDGDGRPDLWQIGANGTVSVRRGGNSTLAVHYWYRTPNWTCTGLSPADPWDFDGDSFHEMALGSPGEDIDAITNAGAVNVIYGSKDGPVTEGDDLLYQDLTMVEGLSESGDRFGGAMTSGDFDRDGRADLVVAAPLDDVGNVVDAGLVNVIMGTSDGLGAADGQLWHRDTSGVIDAAGHGDRFGASLASGDFDGDGFFDLAIGVPRDRVNNQEGAGSVNVLYGTKTGLTAVADQLWHQDSSGILGVAGAGDRFGTSLAVGDFDNDGYDDLAIGAPGDVVGSANGAGQIHIIYGSSRGLTATGNDRFHQDSSGILEVAGANDRFGHSLAAADFDGDGYDDIAVGAPKEDADGKRNVGKVHILFGASSGVTSSGNELWSQSSSGVGDQPQAFDKFGAALAGADFDDDGFDDLAVGTPGEDIAGEKNTGAVTLLYGRSSGLKARSNNFLRQGANGLVGVAEAWDKFGATLRAVDVDGNNRWDLIVGMPGEDLSAVDAGAAILILGHNTGLNLNNSSVWHQNSPGIEGTVEAGDGFGKM